MFAIIDVAIGLIFVYLLLSILCSAISEIIEVFLKKRSKNLERCMKKLLLQDSDLVESIYNHPLIDGLFRGKYKADDKERRKGLKLPSYIPSRNFALALMSIAGITGGLVESSKKIRNQKAKEIVEDLAVAVENDIKKLQENIEAWYDSAMERVSGWYKRRAQWILLIIGYVVAISMNVCTITIADRLSDDGALREVLVTRAIKLSEQSVGIEPATGESDEQPENVTPEASGGESGEQPTPSKKFAEAKGEIEELGLPIGWSESAPKDKTDWLIHCIGWSLTAFAVTLGAPFWFDLLSRFINIRSTVKSKESKSSETGETPRPQGGTS